MWAHEFLDFKMSILNWWMYKYVYEHAVIYSGNYEFQSTEIIISV